MIDATRPDAIASMLRTLESYADQAKGSPAIEPPAPEGVDFGDAVRSAVDQVNATQQSAAAMKSAYERGDEQVALTDVVLSMQKSSLAFEYIKFAII
ncbi:MAG: flagellar hook-basal body complex protein FliE [Pseudomonadales bacterium]